ncbi:CpsD/CapB family tyrosine-protein kinase [Priestia megaterium]|nr:CpsD/CapB family tyrosine-protein kinase [Priestia megaterium]
MDAVYILAKKSYWLNEADDISATVRNPHVTDLWSLTSGPIPPNSAEPLGSQAMEELLEEIYSQFDMIIFDKPPVLLVADAFILANQCDGIVLVMKSGAVEKDAALKAKDILEHADGKLLGVVLNQKKQPADGQYYYYGTKA